MERRQIRVQRSGQKTKVYTFLLAALSLFPLVLLAEEHPMNETEEQRLDVVRIIIGHEKIRRFEYEYRQKNSTAPSCDVMLDDLLNNREHQPIEPVAVLNHQYPLSLNEDLSEEEEALKKSIDEQMGPMLVKALNRCWKAEAEGDEERARVLFTAFHEPGLEPPIRLYVLPDAISPFPDSKLLFLAYTSKRLGYSWVNLNKCENSWGISYPPISSLERDPEKVTSALAIYRGRLVAWVVAKNFLFKVEHYEPDYHGNVKAGTLCEWAAYPK